MVDFSVDWYEAIKFVIVHGCSECIVPRPVLLYRCPPSIMMEPVMADLSEKYPETLFLKVDAEICTVRPQFVDYSCFFFIGRQHEFLRQNLFYLRILTTHV